MSDVAAQNATTHFAKRFDAFAARQAATDPDWLDALRREAFGHFVERGIPRRDQEGWRETNFAPIATEAFDLATRDGTDITREQVEELAFPVFACSVYVFVNGHYAPHLAAPRALSGDLHVESFSALRTTAPERLRAHLAQLASIKENPFVALSTAFLDDGALMRIPAGEVVEQPVHLVFLSTGSEGPAVSHPRLLIEVGDGAKLTVIQDHVSIGKQARFTNAVTETITGANASLELVLLQRESDATLGTSTLCSLQGRDSRVGVHTVTLGGALQRNDLSAILAEEGAECRLNGLVVGAGSQHVDNQTSVDHAMPHGSSQQCYKAIAAERARSIFRGRIMVRPGAQLTNAVQSSPNLVLSPDARVDAKPELEIYADDVKCSHGATIGQLDQEAFFYLRSRGIGAREAQSILTQGFASEITHALPVEALGTAIEAMVAERLRAVSGAEDRT